MGAVNAWGFPRPWTHLLLPSTCFGLFLISPVFGWPCLISKFRLVTPISVSVRRVFLVFPLNVRKTHHGGKPTVISPWFPHDFLTACASQVRLRECHGHESHGKVGGVPDLGTRRGQQGDEGRVIRENPPNSVVKQRVSHQNDSNIKKPT